MERIRIRMLQSLDSLKAGTEYNLPEEFAQQLIADGKAEAVETTKATGPTENKVVKPAKNKKQGN